MIRSTPKTIIALGIVFFLAFTNELLAQRVGFMSSDLVRKHLPEAKAATQRIQSIVEEWKRELEAIETNIKNLEFEIEKNRLVWSDKERAEKESKLMQLKQGKVNFAKEKFEAGGEYDKTVETIMKPIEEKIYAAVQQVAAEEKFDIIWDKSVMPLPYVNFKYDLTVKILRKLDVDVSELEKELEEKIEKDPRNKRRDTKRAPRRRSRSRTPAPPPTEEEKKEPEMERAPDKLPDMRVNPGNEENKKREEEEIER